MAKFAPLTAQFVADTSGFESSINRLEKATGSFAVSASGSFEASFVNASTAMASQSQKATDKFAQQATKQSKTAGNNAGQSFSDSFLNRAKDIAGGVATIFAGIKIQQWFKQATNYSEQFIANMQRATAIAGNVSAEMRSRLEQQAISTSRNLGYSPAEVASGYRALYAAGLSSEQAIGAIDTAASFAKASLMGMSEATDLLIQSTSAMGVNSKIPSEFAENYQRVADTIVQAGNEAVGGPADIANALANAAGQLRASGKEIEEGAAVLAVLDKIGYRGQEGGTRLMIMLRDLQTASIENRSAFERMNISVFDSAGNMRHTADIIEDFERSLKRFNPEAQRMIINQLGITGRAQAGTLALMGNSAAIRELEKSIRDASHVTQNVGTRSTTAYEKAIADARASTQRFAIQLTQPFVRTFGNAMNWAAGMVEKFSDSSIARFAGFAAAAGVFVMVTEGIYRAVRALRTFAASTVFARIAAGDLTAVLSVTVGAAAFVGTLALFNSAIADSESSMSSLNSTVASSGEGFSSASSYAGQFGERMNQTASSIRNAREELTKFQNEQTVKQSSEDREKEFQEYYRKIQAAQGVEGASQTGLYWKNFIEGYWGKDWGLSEGYTKEDAAREMFEREKGIKLESEARQTLADSLQNAGYNVTRQTADQLDTMGKEYLGATDIIGEAVKKYSDPYSKFEQQLHSIYLANQVASAMGNKVAVDALNFEDFNTQKEYASAQVRYLGYHTERLQEEFRTGRLTFFEFKNQSDKLKKQIEEVNDREVFSKMITDAESLREWLKTPSEKMADSMLRWADMLERGTITYDEFIKASIKIMMKPQDIKSPTAVEAGSQAYYTMLEQLRNGGMINAQTDTELFKQIVANMQEQLKDNKEMLTKFNTMIEELKRDKKNVFTTS